MKKTVSMLSAVALLLISFGVFAQKGVSWPGHVQHGAPLTPQQEQAINAELQKNFGQHWLYLHYSSNGESFAYKCEVIEFFQSSPKAIWVTKSCVDDAKNKARKKPNWHFEKWSLHYKNGELRFDMPYNEWTWKVENLRDAKKKKNYDIYVYTEKKK